MKIIYILFFFMLSTYSIIAQCNVDGISIDAALLDPNGTSNFDTDLDGTAETADEFVQICNTTNAAIDLSTYTFGDDESTTSGISLFGTIPAGECFVIMDQYTGTPPANFIILPANKLSLANSGEPLILENTATGNGCVIAMGVTCAAEMIPGYSCDEWPEGTEGVVKVMGIDIPNITPAELGQSSLPVKFVSFTASRKKHVTILEWATAIEINNDIFEIERSTDGRRFEKIDQIVGNGTTYNTSIYSYTDNYSINGTNYYRLKQIDFDGKSAYSSIAKTTYNEKSAVRIYPNTTSGLLNIDLGHLSTAYGSVMDINGQKVKAFTINNNYSTLDISNLSNGVYLIQITTNIKSETIKIFKD